MAACAPVFDPAIAADAQLAARVKTVLVNDGELGARAIEVRVTNGVALLSGRVRTPAEADRAMALARGVQGISDVQSALQIGVEPSPVPPADRPPERPGEVELRELEGPPPGLLAVGASFGWSRPASPDLRSRRAVGPLFRLGRGRGLGPAIAFDWIASEMRPRAGSPLSGAAHVRIRPIMAGLSYTFAFERASIAPSLVAGYAFNSLRLFDAGGTAGLPIDVHNSLVWRPGISVWIETPARTAVNLSAGYLLTTARMSVLEDGRLVRRDHRANAFIMRAGLAYTVF